MSFISKLSLNHFRNYEALHLSSIPNGLLVLHGANGAGKTNILEALSFLSPGRGLRSAKATEIQRKNFDEPSEHSFGQSWAISTEMINGGIVNQLGTGLNPETQRRIVRINGAPAKSQSSLTEYISCLWLTPQMDRLFLEGASGRRRFLDRMIFAFDPSHAGRVTRYENALRQRSKLLQEDSKEPAWLEGLEAQMAETAIAITATRHEFLERLKLSFAKNKADEHYFPIADMALKGELEDLLTNNKAVAAEQKYCESLKGSRHYDAVAGGAKAGAHKSDLEVKYRTKDMMASQCSTGEQKALLISIVMAHAQMIAAETGAPPILLLDEIAAHLDDGRREALFEKLQTLGGQVWMTGTDAILFESIQDSAHFYAVKDGQVSS